MFVRRHDLADCFLQKNKSGQADNEDGHYNVLPEADLTDNCKSSVPIIFPMCLPLKERII